jgi:hypothetical protein
MAKLLFLRGKSGIVARVFTIKDSIDGDSKGAKEGEGEEIKERKKSLSIPLVPNQWLSQFRSR